MAIKSTYTKEEFEEALNSSESIRDVLIKLNLSPKGGNYKTFYKIAKRLDVDVSIFERNATANKHIKDNITDDMFIEAVKTNISFRSVLAQFGLTETGANNTWVRNKIVKMQLDISHFKGMGHLKGCTHNWNKTTPLKDILVSDYDYSSNALKRRLVKANLLIWKCAICDIFEWQNAPISLELDHINGIHTDNRIENLRILCPNCHSQTDTFRNSKRKSNM